MPVNAIRDDYHGDMKDTVDKYNGQQLFSISWDKHMMFATPFCFPVDPQMKFADMVNKVLPGLYGRHPDFEKIDWDSVEWIMSGEKFEPDFDKSFEDNGIVHKQLVRFSTPELTGINGAAT